MQQVVLVGLYLVAIVIANLLVAAFGPGISIAGAFFFIGLDLSTRDRLHEIWHNDRFIIKMAGLILCGSILSYILNANAGQIGIASFIAFGVAAIADTIVYNLLHRQKWLWRSNGSNLVSAAVDSIFFPWIAFGEFMLWVTLGQFIAKVIGGFLWSLILNHFRPKNKKVVGNDRQQEIC